jgi:hypothetical protein
MRSGPWCAAVLVDGLEYAVQADDVGAVLLRELSPERLVRDPDGDTDGAGAGVTPHGLDLWQVGVADPVGDLLELPRRVIRVGLGHAASASSPTTIATRTTRIRTRLIMSVRQRDRKHGSVSAQRRLPIRATN